MEAETLARVEYPPSISEHRANQSIERLSEVVAKMAEIQIRQTSEPSQPPVENRDFGTGGRITRGPWPRVVEDPKARAQDGQKPVKNPGREITGIWSEKNTGFSANARPEVYLNAGSSKPNTRQMPEQMPVKIPAKSPDENHGHLEAENHGLLDQMPAAETLTGIENLDQSAGWDDLWRIEKDGNNYRWRLRFAPTRVSQPGGKITPEIRKRLKSRPGKGRHAGSRADAARLGRRAELAAISLRPGAKRRPKGKNNSANDEGRPDTGSHNPDSGCIEMQRMSKLDQWDNMPDLPVM